MPDSYIFTILQPRTGFVDVISNLIDTSSALALIVTVEPVALEGGLSLPVALYGDYEPPSDEGVLDAYVDGDYSYNGPGTSERFFFVAPLPVNGGGDLSTEAVLGPRDSDNERPRPPSLENVAGVDGVGVQQLLDARGEGSLGYVAAGRKTSAGLDLGGALQETGVAIVTDENPAANIVRRPPRVYTAAPVSLVYANVGDLLAAYATDISTGEPAEGVVIMLNATSQQGDLRFSGSITTGPDGTAQAILANEDGDVDDEDDYGTPLSLIAVTPDGDVVLAQFLSLQLFEPRRTPLIQATVRTDHSAAAPGQVVNVLAFLSKKAQAADGSYTARGQPFSAWFEVCTTSTPSFCQDVNVEAFEVDVTFGSATVAIPIDEDFAADLGAGLFEARLRICPDPLDESPPSTCTSDSAARAEGSTYFEVLGDSGDENAITLDVPERVATELAQFDASGVVSAPVGQPVADVPVVVAWERQVTMDFDSIPINPSGIATVRTDETGAFRVTIDLQETAALLEAPSRDAFPTPVRIYAYWRAPTGRLVFARDVIDVQGPAGALQIRTSLRQPRLPGVPFSIVADRVLTSDGPPVPGPPATITSTPISAALCAQLSSCSAVQFSSRAIRFSRTNFDATSSLDREMRDVSINATESDLLRAAGEVVCAGVATSTDDWQACRYELPALGLYALMACSDGAAEEQCSVLYRGATDIQRQLAARSDFDMPTTAMHLLQPANGTLLPAGEDVVVQFDVPMPGASALLVWAQTLGPEADFLVAPLQRGLSTITFPAPAYCADEPCAIDSGVTWPRFGPLGERPQLGGPWPPPSPGAHVADIGVARGNPQVDRQLTFQTQSEKGVLRALVDAPGPVMPGESFQISASVQSCRRGTDSCGNSAGDVLVYIFAVDAAWAAAETQAPFVQDVLGPAADASGSIRDVGRVTSVTPFPFQPRIERPIEFELTLAALLSLETERDLAQLVELNARLLAANPWAEPRRFAELLASLDLLLVASAQPLHDAPQSPPFVSRGNDPFDDVYYEEYTTTGLATFNEISYDFSYNEVAFATAQSSVEQTVTRPEDVVLFFRELRLSPQEAAAFTVSATAPDLPADYIVRIVAASADDPTVASTNTTLSVTGVAGALLPDVPAIVRVGDEASVAVDVLPPAGATFPLTLAVQATVDSGSLADGAQDVQIPTAGGMSRAVFDFVAREVGNATVTFALDSGATASATFEVVAAADVGAAAIDDGFDVFVAYRAFDAALGLATGPLICEAALFDTLGVTVQVTTTEPRSATTVRVQLPAGLEAVSPVSLAAFPDIRRLDSPRPPTPAEGDEFRIEQPVCYRPWYLRPDFVPAGEPDDNDSDDYDSDPDYPGLREVEELTDEQRAMDQPCPSLELIPGGAVFTVPSLSAGTHELTLLAFAAFPGEFSAPPVLAFVDADAMISGSSASAAFTVLPSSDGVSPVPGGDSSPPGAYGAGGVVSNPGTYGASSDADAGKSQRRMRRPRRARPARSPRERGERRMRRTHRRPQRERTPRRSRDSAP